MYRVPWYGYTTMYLFNQLWPICFQFLNYHKHQINILCTYTRRIFLKVGKLRLKEVNEFCLKAEILIREWRGLYIWAVYITPNSLPIFHICVHIFMSFLVNFMFCLLPISVTSSTHGLIWTSLDSHILHITSQLK